MSIIINFSMICNGENIMKLDAIENPSTNGNSSESLLSKPQDKQVANVTAQAAKLEPVNVAVNVAEIVSPEIAKIGQTDNQEKRTKELLNTTVNLQGRNLADNPLKQIETIGSERVPQTQIYQVASDKLPNNLTEDRSKEIVQAGVDLLKALVAIKPNQSSTLFQNPRVAKQENVQLPGAAVKLPNLSFVQFAQLEPERLRNPSEIIHLHVDNKKLFAKRQINRYPYYYQNPVQENRKVFENNLHKETINNAQNKANNFGVFDLDKLIASKLNEKPIGINQRPLLSKTDDKVSEITQTNSKLFDVALLQWFKKMFAASMNKLG